MTAPSAAAPTVSSTLELWRAAPADPAAGWRLVADQVMGGVSSGTLVATERDGADCVCMSGEVRLENNGGFLQILRDLPPAHRDASAYHGVLLEVAGNDDAYGLHLKTGDVQRPWQSYRATFTATPQWSTILVPFALFRAHRLNAPFDLTDLRRLALVAIGRAFHAEVCVRRIAFYRA